MIYPDVCVTQVLTQLESSERIATKLPLCCVNHGVITHVSTEHTSAGAHVLVSQTHRG